MTERCKIPSQINSRLIYILRLKGRLEGYSLLFLEGREEEKQQKDGSSDPVPPSRNSAFPSFLLFDLCILSIVVVFAKDSRMLRPLFPMLKVRLPSFRNVQHPHENRPVSDILDKTVKFRH